MNDTEILYSESAGRIVIEVSEAHAGSIEKLFGRDASCIGRTQKDPRLVVSSLSGETVINEGIAALKAAWKATLDF
jgi:phosphoribosylformylglycinamidine (FGAM) synthase-like enzyme